MHVSPTVYRASMPTTPSRPTRPEPMIAVGTAPAVDEAEGDEPVVLTAAVVVAFLVVVLRPPEVTVRLEAPVTTAPVAEAELEPTTEAAWAR
jgi:hypothetical protein